jgi:hypothetical protein
MSFWNRGTYRSPTTGQFNMCNCTPRHRSSRGCLTGDPTPLPRLRQARPQGGRPPTVRAQNRSRWTRRSPARSTTRLRMGPVGAGPASLGASVRAPRPTGGSAGLPGYSVVQASLRCCGMPASRARTSASR